MKIMYWVYYDKTGVWRKLVATDFQEMLKMIERISLEVGEPPEQLIRTYK